MKNRKADFSRRGSFLQEPAEIELKKIKETPKKTLAKFGLSLTLNLPKIMPSGTKPTYDSCNCKQWDKVLALSKFQVYCCQHTNHD